MEPNSEWRRSDRGAGRPELYAADWRQYRWRVRAFWAAWQGGLLAIFLTRWLLGRVTPALLAAAMVWIAACAITTVQLALWPCPRCRRRFSRGWLLHSVMTRRCVHCGLLKP